MEQPIYEYVMAQLEAARGRWPEVAAGSGVSKRTIEKIARSEIVDPGVSHVQKLADYFVRVAQRPNRPQQAARGTSRGQMNG